MTVDKRIFTAENMSAGYNGRTVVSDINISVDSGSIVCLIGPNGSGKSTVLRTVTGQLPLISGDMHICGRPMSEMSEKEIAKYISVVLTDRIDPELMTCRDVVATGRYPYTGRMGLLSAADRKKVDESLEMADALKISEKNFSEISDGQRQRIMLARAVCQEPELMVLDEPTSFLDIRYKLEIMSVLKKLSRRKGMGILMSVHELELVRAAADYVICLKDGGVFAEGTPKEVFRKELIYGLYDIRMDMYDECFKNMKIV
jgi:iron complex transport system ATP-binding protein